MWPSRPGCPRNRGVRRSLDSRRLPGDRFQNNLWKYAICDLRSRDRPLWQQAERPPRGRAAHFARARFSGQSSLDVAAVPYPRLY